VTTSNKMASPACVSLAPSAAAELEAMPVDTSEWSGSSVRSSPSMTSNREDQWSSPARLKSPLASSLRAFLLHERSGVEVSVSPDATAGGGCVSRSIEMGDL
jgi:hypothetical protein